jgi:uncharacterized protein DUF4259
MSTWGTGLFASDSAQDFLDDLSELDAGDRILELDRAFTELLADPSALMQTVFPEPLIAAAALVALSLPGGQRIMDLHSRFGSEAIESASLDRPAPDLAANALRVLAIVTAPDGHWSRSWRRPDDRDAALSGIEAVKQILGSAHS